MLHKWLGEGTGPLLPCHHDTVLTHHSTEEKHRRKAQNEHKARYSKVDVGTVFGGLWCWLSLVNSAGYKQGENASQCCKHSGHCLPMTHTHIPTTDWGLAYLSTHDSRSIVLRQDSSKAEGGGLEDRGGSVHDEHGDQCQGKEFISPWRQGGSREAQLM